MRAKLVVEMKECADDVIEMVEPKTTVIPALLKRKGGKYTTQASGSAFTMTSGDTVRYVIADDPGNSALQQLKVYVAGTLRLTTTAIDDEWSSGETGLAVLAHASGAVINHLKCRHR